MPFPVTMTVLERGPGTLQHLLHALPFPRGQWRGMIVQRGYKPAGNFHEPSVSPSRWATTSTS